MSPLPPIAHLIAIAAGLWGGLWVMGAITPDLPGAEVEAGVVADDQAVPPDDSASLLREDNLEPALTQLAAQLGAGGEIVRLRIDPGRLRAEEGDGGFDVTDVDPAAPERLVQMVAQERPKVTPAEIQYVELVQTKQGPVWYVQPVGGAPPVQISP